MAIIECSCGAKASYDELQAQCPNDIITQNPGWSQDDQDNWVCPDCSLPGTTADRH